MEFTIHNSQLIRRYQESTLQKKKSRTSGWTVLACFIGAFLCVASCELELTRAAATQPSNQIATWFSDLANRDASARDQARVNLMGISRKDLEELRTIVDKSRPLAPSQAMVLRDIVEQVYQASEPYEPLEDKPGFLGMQFDPMSLQESTPDDAQAGVVVMKRIPGFCAYRFLRDGDVIVGITEAPDHPIRKGGDLTALVGGAKAGVTVHLQVLRGGQQIEVPITLDARPNWAQQGTPNATQDAIRERQRQAEEYWDQHFAPLLDAEIL